MKLLLPDSLWNLNQVSGASFIYFHNEQIGFTLHPSVSSFLTGIDHFTFLSYLENQSPDWAPQFQEFFKLWYNYCANLHATYEVLKPLQKKAFLTVQLVYDRGMHGWNAAEEILGSSSLEPNEVKKLIDPFHAADELFAHIFFEKVLEVQYPGKPVEFFLNLGKEAIGQEIKLRRDFDWAPIYAYCNELFTHYSLEELLTRAYMFRMPIIGKSSEFMLSNERLMRFLASMPIKPEIDESSPELADDRTLDTVAWEFFRQLLSPVVDPLDASKVAIISEIIDKRADEIKRLKTKCWTLAADIGSEKNIDKLIDNVSNYIQVKIQTELNDVLQIDKSSFDAFITDLFSDPKTWATIATFVYSVVNGGEVLTAGSSIAGLSTFGAKAFKQAADRRKKLATSSYSLVYRMKMATG